MMKDILSLQIPAGVKDLLPQEANRKRQLEGRLSELFQAWGYGEVVTPTFEYLDAMAVDTGEELQDRIFRFFDRQGRILALRPEMTTPIARLVATRLKGAPLPLRLYYLANVFRYEATQAGRQREFYQAGVEVLGAEGPLADAEVIALAVEAIRSSGLDHFQISLGQIEIFNGLMEEIPLPEEDKIRVKDLVARKDYVGLEELLQRSHLKDAEKDLLLTVPGLHGGAEVLDLARRKVSSPRAQAGLDNLEEVYRALESFAIGNHVALDLGVLRGYDYYTGVVFEGYTGGLGFPICGGGRYDKLLARFGYPIPATGFALGLERILLALGQGEETREEGGCLVWGEDPAQVIAQTLALRRQGVKAEMEISGRSLPEALTYARERGISKLMAVEPEGLRELAVE